MVLAQHGSFLCIWFEDIFCQFDVLANQLHYRQPFDICPNIAALNLIVMMNYSLLLASRSELKFLNFLV